MRAAQVIESEVNVRLINRPLKNLAILFKERGPDRFSFPHRSADRPLEGLPLYRALDFCEKAKLPLRREATRFLREPDVQLARRQRMCPVFKFHQTAPRCQAASGGASFSHSSSAKPRMVMVVMSVDEMRTPVSVSMRVRSSRAPNESRPYPERGRSGSTLRRRIRLTSSEIRRRTRVGHSSRGSWSSSARSLLVPVVP